MHRSAVALVLECDDLVGHLLGFVGDRQKIAVMSLLNKTFARMVKEPGSWKWGSDGVVMRRPTLERLRLLRAVRGGHKPLPPTQADEAFACCPALVSVRWSYPLRGSNRDACDALAPRMQTYDACGITYVNDITMLNTLMRIRAPQLHTLVARMTHIDHAAFPRLTDLTDVDVPFGRGPRPIPDCMRTLWRLSVDISALEWAPAIETSLTWSLRSLTLTGVPMGRTGSISITCDLMIRMCALCPHLDALQLKGSTRMWTLIWTASDLGRLADATPRLTHLECQLENVDDDDYSSAYADHPTMWPCLTSLTVNYNPAYIIRNLQNAHLLRRLVAVYNPEDGESSLLRALIDRSPPLTSLVMLDDVGWPHWITRSALEAIGSTLERLEAAADAVDVGRYCPRMRDFCLDEGIDDATDGLRWDVRHIGRGCPLMRTVAS
jgi:hypothetical protein